MYRCWLMMFALILTPFSSSAGTCVDQPAGKFVKGVYPPVHPEVHFVDPPYAGFDPCHRSVQLKLNDQSSTLVIVLHGGGGGDQAQSQVGVRFENAGYSVLMFDAFKMNRLDRDPVFWSTSVHAGSMGRMIYFSALAAIKWVLQTHPARAQKIVVYGISTGASAAMHLAATPGLDALVQVYAEAPNNAGIGMPNELLKPVLVFYGQQDNYGGRTEDEHLWQRRSSCLWNSPIDRMPASNTENCNHQQFIRGQMGQTVEEYIESQKRLGAPITYKLIPGAGHGIFNGRNIQTVIRSTPSGIKLYMTTGAQAGVADQLFKELLAEMR